MKLKYEKEMITERDYYNMLNTAKADGLAEGEAKGLAEGEAKGRAKGREEGRAEGLAEGREEGRAEGRVEGLAEGETIGRNEEKIRIAKALKENGVADNIIAATTGIPEWQIATLK